MGVEEGDIGDICEGKFLLAEGADSFTICVPVPYSGMAEAGKKILEDDEKRYGRTILKGILGCGIGCALFIGSLKFDYGLVVDSIMLLTGIVSSGYGGANLIRELELRAKRESLEEFESKYCPQIEKARSIDDTV